MSSSRAPPQPKPGKTVAYTPKTKTEFATAMNNAVSGDVIEIPGGDHGDWSFTSTTTKNRSGIIVRAQDRGNRPVFENSFININQIGMAYRSNTLIFNAQSQTLERRMVRFVFFIQLQQYRVPRVLLQRLFRSHRDARWRR